MRKVLVCGGRDYQNRDVLFRILDAAHAVDPIYLLIHGGAKGADDLADEWAHERDVETLTFKADWKTDGKAAGPIRNRRMLLENPALVIAFPGGKGTADMKRQAWKAGVPTVTVNQ